jgi:hypothetical protein
LSLPDSFGQSSNNAFIKTVLSQVTCLDHPDKPGDDFVSPDDDFFSRGEDFFSLLMTLLFTALPQNRFLDRLRNTYFSLTGGAGEDGS